jgi:integrase-like protein/Arm domain-containing DNA-binding protein
MPALTKRALDAAEPRSAEFFLWCGNLAGFGARIYPSGKKVFVAQVRVGRATRRIKIGGFGAYTVDQARERARAVIQAASEGRDPQREKQDARRASTVAELCEAYLEAARAGLVTTRFKRAKRPATVAIDEGRVSRHIVPLIGTIPARDLRRTDVQRMADAIASGKTAGIFKGKPRGRAVVTGGAGTAARVVELLGGIYSWGEKRDLVPAGPSPTRGVETARGDAKNRTLSIDELRALGRVLKRRQNATPMAAAAIRLIALTGLRREEACGLRWREIDEAGQCLRLEATKTGRSTRPIGKPALDLLRSLPREDGIDWVFPRSDRQGSADMKKPFAALFDAAGLADVRSHDLRRTFGSVAADQGFGDATIAELLGHARRGVTQTHYIRRSDPIMVAAANKIAIQIAAALDGKPIAEAVPLAEHKV